MKNKTQTQLEQNLINELRKERKIRDDHISQRHSQKLINRAENRINYLEKEIKKLRKSYEL